MDQRFMEESHSARGSLRRRRNRIAPMFGLEGFISINRHVLHPAVGSEVVRHHAMLHTAIIPHDD